MWFGLPRTVIVLGWVSLFNDLASEMVVPLIPILLASVLAGGPVALGLIEGVADAVAAMLKLWSGRHADQVRSHRKLLAVAGYSISNLVRPLIAFSAGWPMLLVLRSVDRVGKGIRSAPRDALIADAVRADMRGKAFGLHRAFDNGGAVAGSLVAAAALTLGLSLVQVIAWSALPGMLAVLLFAFGVGRTRQLAVVSNVPIRPLAWRDLHVRLRHYLILLALFAFARASETFIVLRGHDLGMSTVNLLLLWALLSLAKSMAALRGGVLADSLGRLPVILVSWTGYAASFLMLALAGNEQAIWLVTLMFGVLAGLSEGADRAIVGDCINVELRASAYGWYYWVTGLAAIPAGLFFGVIWHYCGARLAFACAGLLGSVVALLAWRLLYWRHKNPAAMP